MSIQAEVEGPGPGSRKDVVVEVIPVRKGHRGADGHEGDVGRKGLVVHRDLDPLGRRTAQISFQPEHSVVEIGGGAPLFGYGHLPR